MELDQATVWDCHGVLQSESGVRAFWVCIGVIWELYGDTGKQHGNYYLGFGVYKCKKFQHVEDGKYYLGFTVCIAKKFQHGEGGRTEHTLITYLIR